MTSYVTNMHPSQYEVPAQPMNTAYPMMYSGGNPTYTEKKVGEKINQAFMITVIFLVLSNSYRILDNAYYMFTQKQFEFIQENIGNPTTKGYIIVSLLFFCSVLWILYQKN